MSPLAIRNTPRSPQSAGLSAGAERGSVGPLGGALGPNADKGCGEGESVQPVPWFSTRAVDNMPSV